MLAAWGRRSHGDSDVAAAREPRLRGTVIQTVGMKGHDGLAIAVVVDPPKADAGN